MTRYETVFTPRGVKGTTNPEPRYRDESRPRSTTYGEPIWCEDDEADCPGCGEHLRANITGDGESEWIEAIPTNEDLVDG